MQDNNTTTPINDDDAQVDDRLQAINAALAAKQTNIDEEVARLEAQFGVANDGCPVDPQERAQCEACQ